MMFVENVLRYLFPNTKLFHYERTIKVPFVGKIILSPLRLIGRSIAVAITTVLVSNSSKDLSPQARSMGKLSAALKMAQ